MLPKTVTVAQIGVGYCRPNILRSLIGNSRCQAKAVADLSEERRAFVRGVYPNNSASRDVELGINDNEIDATVLATPAATHFDLAMQCLKAGKHFLIVFNHAIAARHAREILSLPIFPQLTDEQMRYVVESVKDFYAHA